MVSCVEEVAWDQNRAFTSYIFAVFIVEIVYIGSAVSCRRAGQGGAEARGSGTTEEAARRESAASHRDDAAASSFQY